MTMQVLAGKIETTPQNLSNKLNRDNFNEKELNDIAHALDCSLDISLILKETGEKV